MSRDEPRWAETGSLFALGPQRVSWTPRPVLQSGCRSFRELVVNLTRDPSSQVYGMWMQQEDATCRYRRSAVCGFREATSYMVMGHHVFIGAMTFTFSMALPLESRVMQTASTMPMQ